MTPPARRDNDLDTGRRDRPGCRVARDMAPGHRDRGLSPEDRDERPSPPANESRYAAAPAVGGQGAADAENPHAAAGSAFRIEVEDGYVIATADPVLSDAAADVLWRIVEKAMREDEDR